MDQNFIRVVAENDDNQSMSSYRGGNANDDNESVDAE
jgi:hypothetical protein